MTGKTPFKLPCIAIDTFSSFKSVRNISRVFSDFHVYLFPIALASPSWTQRYAWPLWLVLVVGAILVGGPMTASPCLSLVRYITMAASTYVAMQRTTAETLLIKLCTALSMKPASCRQFSLFSSKIEDCNSCKNLDRGLHVGKYSWGIAVAANHSVWQRIKSYKTSFYFTCHHGVKVLQELWNFLAAKIFLFFLFLFQMRLHVKNATFLQNLFTSHCNQV